VPLSGNQIPELQRCVANLKQRDSCHRARLRVTLDRLNRAALAGFRAVDRAIELGIALESLYAPDRPEGSITFALRMRAARFLGGSLAARRETFKIVNEAYRLRSSAMHTGLLENTDEVIGALQKGQSVVARSLKKVIEGGDIVWKDFDIDVADERVGN